MTEKGPAAFRTISEASAQVGVPSHVLRFWETRFSFIRPMKRAGGRRFYRPHDVEVLRGLRTLLHDQGYTIRGVQKLHKEGGLGRLLAATAPGGSGDQPGPASSLASSPSVPPNPLEEGGAAGGGYLLDAAARSRLGAVLTDLERVKACVDALLEPR